VSQGESAVTEPQVSAADQAQAGQMLEESVPASPDAADEVPGAMVPGDADGDGDGDADGDAAPSETEWVGGAAGDAGAASDDDADAASGDAGAASGDAAPGLTDIADLELEGEIAADYIEGLLDVADLDGDIDMDVEGDRAMVSVVGATLDELVGSRGEVLEALQELTRLAVHRHTGMRTRIMIDVGGYRLRRRSELAETGRDAADEVKRTGEPKKLWAMNPFERKIVHDAVAAAGLRSESEGEEPDRRVVVLPAN
jgi:spoIIIJ-associated protein